MCASNESGSHQLLASTVPDYFGAAAVLDDCSLIQWTSPEFLRRFGCGGGALGRACYEVVHRRDRACGPSDETCPAVACRRSRRPARAVHRHDGGESPTQIECFPIVDHRAGRVERVLHVTRDCEVGPETEAQRVAGRNASELLELVARAAASDAAVIIEGETGTGKELLARAIHAISPRAAGPFVPVDCSSLRESLLDSELFGHEKGAFTGADSSHAGLVAASDGGTLFLDEVGDIPGAVQLKLLRLLENRTYRRVGSTVERGSDFRLICASHPGLPALVESGQIRTDFYYRIHALKVSVPPLRERIGGLPGLVEQLKLRLGCGDSCQLSEHAMRLLREHSFPGNVRELLHMLERACLLAGGRRITADHLELSEGGSATPREFRLPMTEVVTLRELERVYLQWLRGNYRGDRRELARALGLSERTLYRRLRQI